MTATNNVNFWTGKNYMKRDSSTGTVSIAAPVTSAYGGALFRTQQIITHNLGIVPFFEAYYEPFKDSVVWPAMGSRLGSSAVNPRSTSTFGPYLIAWADATFLTLEIGYFNNTLTGTYPAYFTIYKDFGLA